MKKFFLPILLIIFFVSISSAQTEKPYYSVSLFSSVNDIGDTIVVRGYGITELAARQMCYAGVAKLDYVTLEKTETAFTIKHDGSIYPTPDTIAQHEEENLYSVISVVETPAKMKHKPVESFGFIMNFGGKPSFNSASETRMYLNAITEETANQLAAHVMRYFKKKAPLKLDYLYVDFDPKVNPVKVTVRYAIATMQ